MEKPIWGQNIVWRWFPVIVINKGEVDVIKKLEGITLQKIMLVLLAISKLKTSDIVSVSKKDILMYSKCNISNDSLSVYLYKLNQLGYIQSLTNGTRRVLIHDDTPPSFKCSLEDVVKEYLKTCKESGYVYCSECGKKTKRQSNRQKYCSKCAKEKSKLNHAKCVSKLRTLEKSL